MSLHTDRPNPRERGATLTILAMVMAIMLVSLGTAHLVLARDAIRATYAREAHLAALYAAEAGISDAVAALARGSPDLPGPGAARVLGEDEARYEVRRVSPPLLAAVYVVRSTGEASRGSQTSSVTVWATVSLEGGALSVESWTIEAGDSP